MITPLPKSVKSYSYLLSITHGFNFGGTSSLHSDTSMIAKTLFT